MIIILIRLILFLVHPTLRGVGGENDERRFFMHVALTAATKIIEIRYFKTNNTLKNELILTLGVTPTATPRLR